MFNNASGPLQPVIISKQYCSDAVTSRISKEALKYINFTKFVFSWFAEKSKYDEYLAKKLEEAIREAEKVC